MNPVIELRGHLESMPSDKRAGAPSLPKNVTVQASELRVLQNELEQAKLQWQNNPLIQGALIDAVAKRVLPKSKRIKRLFLENSNEIADSFIRSIRYELVTDNELKETHVHVFTYYLPLSRLDHAIQRIRKTADFIAACNGSCITAKELDDFNNPKSSNRNEWNRLLKQSAISKTEMAQLICDLAFIKQFRSYKGPTKKLQGSVLLELITTNLKPAEALRRLNIAGNPIGSDKIVYHLNESNYSLLFEKAPYLICMSTPDSFQLDESECVEIREEISTLKLPTPQNEPTIGVIDTAFDQTVYFHDWVTYNDGLQDFPVDDENWEDETTHGTAVDSILVDGPALQGTKQPLYDDHCGRFKVRHFRLMRGSKQPSSIPFVLNQLEGIIQNNADIKVWNCSFGTVGETDTNVISILGAELDRLQVKYDVLFVVAGTNDNKRINDSLPRKRVGSPADSLNSLVVNSVDTDARPALYSRTGPVLSFFVKPDICYFGGTQEEGFKVIGARGHRLQIAGSSIAAAWISRKAAFLIHNMNLSREVAKALLIDSAAQWKTPCDNVPLKGFGVVPVDIREVLGSGNDEIRFVISGVCTAYETYTYNIPVPIAESKYPYFARATLCYFPQCDRSQGVDYTQTEMDLHFGRLTAKTSKSQDQLTVKYGIKSIDDNTQGDENGAADLEADVRKAHRKWDNVKRVAEKVKSRRYPRSIVNKENPRWGLMIRTKERASSGKAHYQPFGVVVTLKEMFLQNRLSTFIKNCQALGWTVNTINVENRLKLKENLDIDIGWLF